MDPDTHQETYGRYLQALRLEQGLSIEALAQATRITGQCLRAMEDNAHDRLPPRVYVQSFIRTYARAVGADADLAVALYRRDLEQRKQSKQLKRKRLVKLQTLRRSLTAIGLIVVVLLLVRFSDRWLDDAFFRAQATVKPQAPPTPAVTDRGKSARRPAGGQTSKQLKLQVIAVEKTWLKVIVDGQKARSYDLKPEDRLELEGSTNFNLMIGNATGLKVFLDEQPVQIFGSSGQVVSLKLP